MKLITVRLQNEIDTNENIRYFLYKALLNIKGTIGRNSI